MAFNQNIITQRFVDVFNELINRKIVRSQREFAQIIGTTSQNFNLVIKGTRNITIEQIASLLEKFKGVVNPSYLMGIGSPLIGYKDPFQPSVVSEANANYIPSDELGILRKTEIMLNEKIGLLEDKIVLYEELVKMKDSVIADLRKKTTTG